MFAFEYIFLCSLATCFSFPLQENKIDKVAPLRPSLEMTSEPSYIPSET